jgi:hypothetical protein
MIYNMTPVKKEVALKKAATLNEAIEVSYVQLAIVLVEIEEKELWKGEYDSFWDFYTNKLGRRKSTISQLLTVGRWIINNGLLKETRGQSYRKLYASITAHKEREPQYILAAAQTNSLSELEAEHKEKKFGVHEHEAGAERYATCKKCGKMFRI